MKSQKSQDFLIKCLRKGGNPYLPKKQDEQEAWLPKEGEQKVTITSGDNTISLTEDEAIVSAGNANITIKDGDVSFSDGDSSISLSGGTCTFNTTNFILNASNTNINDYVTK